MKKKFLKKYIVMGLMGCFFVGCLIFIVKIFLHSSNYESTSALEQGKNVIEMSQVILQNLTQEELNFGKYKEMGIVYNNNDVSQISFSPSGGKVGFLKITPLSDESIPYDREVILYIGNSQKMDFQEMYHGSYRTAGWDWFSENEVIIYYSCGTECEALSLINVNSHERNNLNYGVNYNWSPNKQFVLAYHYSWKYGITVGDKKGIPLFFIRREHTSGEDEKLTEKTTALWSPDFSKLALVIKKENKNEMEFLVFDVTNNFKQIFQQDVNISGDESPQLKWNEKGETVLLDGNSINIKNVLY